MARLVICDSIRSGDVFVPGQLFMFGSVVLHADPAGRLGQVESFTLGQEIMFGNLEFITDPRGDLTLTKFLAPLEGPTNPKVSSSGMGSSAVEATSTLDLASSSDPIDTPIPTLAKLCPGAVSNDPEAAVLRIEPEYSRNMDPADISSLNELLGQIQAMGMSNGQPSVYDQIGFKPDDREIYVPPITHLAATVEDSAEGSPSQPLELRTDYV